ncbi:MAG TPA: hypothetical protein PJ991_11610 [Kiritimatiellia bacterium]|nr:hypothetical protein [Kiritimatiellia bacterium]
MSFDLVIAAIKATRLIEMKIRGTAGRARQLVDLVSNPSRHAAPQPSHTGSSRRSPEVDVDAKARDAFYLNEHRERVLRIERRYRRNKYIALMVLVVFLILATAIYFYE